MHYNILRTLHSKKGLSHLVTQNYINTNNHRLISYHNNNHNNNKFKKMEASVKCLVILAFLAIAGMASFNPVVATGECPNSTPDAEAMKLFPCASAAQDPDAAVSASCCAQVKRIGKNPKCLCAVMMSNTAKSSGVKPEVALSIPKRCNFADRPIGYKCGAYTLP